MLQQAIEREAILRYVPGTKPRRPANSPVSAKCNLGKRSNAAEIEGR